MSASGTAAAGQVEHMLRQVSPGRYDAYEALLAALADGRVWMLLWHGTAGSPDAQYGSMEVDGLGYAPCVTSAQELSASGWSRSHELVSGRDIARTLFPDRWGIWLNPHAPGGGVGIPWLDLRRISTGLDRLPAGPLRLTEPALELPQFYAQLTQNAHRTPAVRSLRRAWVHPAVGVPYLAIGLDLYDTGRESVDAVRTMMRQSVGAVPDGLPVSTVAMSDEYDPVAMWLRANTRPFYDREPHAPAGPPPTAAPGYGYPPQQHR
ncbi:MULTISPECIES: enhanced serine sensitivity protein SseB C-terminal domain-containing protein [unclassified Streptomyces]|uniref:enhanced serine sensitivity protein SseB C-terminal domain-containing protein n=1 Tax=unclassified Streptomyces TaxID=2593676 RepID=UPI00339FE4D5